MRSTNTTIKMFAAGAVLALAAACGQAPGTINPQQASVSESTGPSTDDSPAAATAATTAAVNRDRAVEIALDRTGGGDVDEVENEVEHGRAAWKVRVVKGGIRYSVYIDKTTGDIIRFRDEGRD